MKKGIRSYAHATTLMCLLLHDTCPRKKVGFIASATESALDFSTLHAQPLRTAITKAPIRLLSPAPWTITVCQNISALYASTS
jgi:hypothetical protein